MRISERFELGVNQYGLDFVDIDPNLDTPLYLSPHVLSSRLDRWSSSANNTVRNFFQFILNQLNAENYDEAFEVFQHLNEPRETCLGQSRLGTRGAGVGSEYAREILNSIIRSRAVETGLISDLEDAIIFVDGVGRDRMSDITTNVIREHLINYTIDQCDNWGIPMQDQIPIGLIWNTTNREWELRTDRALIVDDKVILLVPKNIVTRGYVFSSTRYLKLPVAAFIQNHFENRTGRFLTKNEIAKEPEAYFIPNDGNNDGDTLKDFLRNFTRNHPEVFTDFKQESLEDEVPIENYEIDNDFSFNEIIDHLISTLHEIDPGRDNANLFEKVTASILELIFYPDLINPNLQTRMNNGRKVVDITMENSARRGVFNRIWSNHRIPCSIIFIECKNYNSDPANPEIDQLLGRLSFQNGEFGILVCREVENMELLIARCHDTFMASKRLIIPLTDDDLVNMLEIVRQRYEEADKDIQAYDEILTEQIRRVRLGG